ncbi:putative FBD-associated F-box protein At5g56700 isoform X2 [Arabidopsis lyrata subsp. lyrata]|uniref:putative FBD-associated F-box protein At5g56700 isoform X2 n=1 Tax=Arabidopsis lyrata subsp. lyrata TaxID=81972 RepID=UPI000A29E4EF|nr:putative FBD-associated F-box protein At5g56700 isoform X2 [Arabidopsis lyrata subsp. lyrata]|eukprot:XP_020872402.1 putative FBD-associated F-box protein At5g56700 isoform X2 [Arabidopsis lyrata subsp. lyrata]
MAKISDLSDELLVKILSFLPTQVAVSTSVLSKQWMFIWMWLPKLEFGFRVRSRYACLRDFIDKNLPLHKAPIIESLCLSSFCGLLQPEDLKSWVGIAVSRYVRELSINYSSYDRSVALLPCSLYRCKSLVTLKLIGKKILVDVPPTVCLPSLKTLRLDSVTYSKDESLRLLLSCCPVLDDLFIDQDYFKLVNIPQNVSCSLYSWKSLVTLKLHGEILVDVPPTVCLPSLKTLQLLCVIYLNEESLGLLLSCCAVLEDLSIERGCNDNVKANESSIEHMHMPELEEADISLMEDIAKDIEMLFKSITTVKRLSLKMSFNGGNETVHRDGIVFSQLEDLKLYIRSDNWSKLLVHLLKHSPNLQILNLLLDYPVSVSSSTTLR